MGYFNCLHEIRNALKEEKQENTMETRIEDITDLSVSSIPTADTTYNNSNMIGFEIIISIIVVGIFGFMYFCCFAGESNESSVDFKSRVDLKRSKRMSHTRLESQF